MGEATSSGGSVEPEESSYASGVADEPPYSCSGYVCCAVASCRGHEAASNYAVAHVDELADGAACYSSSPVDSNGESE